MVVTRISKNEQPGGYGNAPYHHHHLAPSEDEATLQNLSLAHQKAQHSPMVAGETNETELRTFLDGQNNVSIYLAEVWQVVENYPYLRTYDAFKEPLKQLEEVSKNIRLEESKFNQQIGLYHIELQKFPNNFLGPIFGFRNRAFLHPDNAN